MLMSGYIVFSGVRRASGVQGLRVIVQSDKSPDYVETRVELFLHKMKVPILSSHTHSVAADKDKEVSCFSVHLSVGNCANSIQKS